MTNAPAPSGYSQQSHTNNASYAYEWFIKHGYTPAAAAGIVGNLIQESHVDPKSEQSGGPGRGIAQWSVDGRWQDLLSWTHANGLDPWTLDGQLAFMKHEMDTNGTTHSLAGVQRVANAATIFMNTYERPDPRYANLSGRILYAQHVFQSGGSYNAGGSVPGGGNTGGASGSYGGGGKGMLGAGVYLPADLLAASTGTGSKPGMTTNQQHDTLSPVDMAARYGWAMSFLKTVPDLWKIFQQATANDWSPAQFTAKLRGTKWFQDHAASVREGLYLQQTDPAEWQARLAKAKADISQAATQLGAVLTPDQLGQIANHQLLFGLDSAQLQTTLGDYIKRIHDSFTGQAGQVQDTIAKYASDMGVRLSDNWVNTAVRNVASGVWDSQRATDSIKNYALSAFPAWQDQINSGMTVKDIASPYIQSMASLLEIDPNQIDVFDPKIRSALNSVDKNGKPSATPLWQFETQMRQDPRWLQTQNAQDTFAQTTRSILNAFGFSF